MYLKNVNEHFSIKRLTELIHISMSVELECYCFTGINILTLVKVLERAADRFNFVSKKKKEIKRLRGQKMPQRRICNSAAVITVRLC